MIEGREGIRNAYRDDVIARDYIRSRFREPLGALLHERQLKRMRQIIGNSRPVNVLEIAPGPARLTVDLASAFAGPGTLLDASAQMLQEARTRLSAAGFSSWRLIQADAFQLPFSQRFDLVYTFRLIRHFEEADRARLYASIAAVLRPGGLLVFDAVNENVARPFRAREGSACHHYDALLNPAQITAEVSRAGLDLLQLEGAQHHYRTQYQLQVYVAPRSRWLARAAMELVDRLPGGQPLEWIVTCARR